MSLNHHLPLMRSALKQLTDFGKDAPLTPASAGEDVPCTRLLVAQGDARRDNSPASGEITPPKTLLHICQQNYKMKGEGISPALSV